jgi:hypothetical protein
VNEIVGWGGLVVSRCHISVRVAWVWSHTIVVMDDGARSLSSCSLQLEQLREREQGLQEYKEFRGSFGSPPELA